MNHSLHTNYQTSFRIVRKDDQTYLDAIHAIFGWLCTKEKDRALTENWKEFRFRGSWEHCYRTNARIQTATCLEEDNHRAWSMEYSHIDRELGGKRFWHIFVGIRDTGQDLVVSARIAYSWNNEDLSSEATPPSPSVPYFIRILVQKFTAFSGRKEFRLIEKPVVLKSAGSGTLVRDFVVSPERRYPLIVFNGDSEHQMKEARRLATELAGKVQVVVIASDPALGRELKEAFPWDYRIAFETMRVFFPISTGLQSPKRHRWFDITTEDYDVQRAGIVHGLLRNHNLIERDSVETISDIQRLISKARIIKLSESTAGASEEEVQALYKEYIAEIESERDEAKQEAEHYAVQIDQLESELRAAEWKSKALGNASTGGTDPDDKRSALATLPATLPEVVTAASSFYADRLTFAAEAFGSAEDSSECELVADAWHIMSHLASTLYELKFKTDQVGDIAKKFQEKSGFEYARSEGPQTKKNAALARLRKISHNGKNYEIWPHIKKGNEGNKMIRIHFDFDNDENKIVIGYVGLHMDNSSTRARK